MIPAVARGDIQAASGLEGKDFEAIAVPIETRAGAPWLLKQTRSDGSEQLTVCEMKNGKAEYHPASPDEAREGVEYPDVAAYLAARAA